MGGGHMNAVISLIILCILFMPACDSDLKVTTAGELAVSSPTTEETGKTVSVIRNKIDLSTCLDPDLNQIPTTQTLTLCNGELGQGRLPACSEDGGVGCVTTDAFKAADMSLVIPANIKSGVAIAGVSGSSVESPAACSADGSVGCVTTSAFKAADMAVALSSHIKSGITIAGVTGSASLELHANCSTDGEIGCATTSAYKAADLTNLVSGNIKNGVLIAVSREPIHPLPVRLPALMVESLTCQDLLPQHLRAPTSFLIRLGCAIWGRLPMRGRSCLVAAIRFLMLRSIAPSRSLVIVILPVATLRQACKFLVRRGH